MEHPPLQSVGAVVRRKDGRAQLEPTSPYSARDYEIICVDAELAEGNTPSRFLPFGAIKYGEDCAQSILKGVLFWTKGLASKQNPTDPNPPGLLGKT